MFLVFFLIFERLVDSRFAILRRYIFNSFLCFFVFILLFRFLIVMFIFVNLFMLVVLMDLLRVDRMISVFFVMVVESKLR